MNLSSPDHPIWPILKTTLDRLLSYAPVCIALYAITSKFDTEAYVLLGAVIGKEGSSFLGTLLNSKGK